MEFVKNTHITVKSTFLIAIAMHITKEIRLACLSIGLVLTAFILYTCNKVNFFRKH